MMVLYTGTYLVSWLVARLASPLLAGLLSGFLPDVAGGSSYSKALLAVGDLNHFFSRGVAFLIIFTIVSFLCHWIVRQLRWIRRVPIVGTVDRLAGGVISFLLGYLVIFIVLTVVQLWPAEWWQLQIANSGLARFIISQTPLLAHSVLQMFG